LRSLVCSIFFFLLISCTSTTEVVEYEIYSNDAIENIDTKLVFNIYQTKEHIELEVQSFPEEDRYIESYVLVFDMKFREDYESEFNGVCLGPSWENFGSGEFSIELKKENYFKNKIKGLIFSDKDDRCKSYFYYLRFLTINLYDGEQILIGVATDYAEKYPDAPEVWLKDKKNGTKIIGESNIEKYSLNFMLKESS
tara:strand:- start:687 stop:1274 length:588 start_codon:yes stop_codon:yes gene_type:complete